MNSNRGKGQESVIWKMPHLNPGFLFLYKLLQELATNSLCVMANESSLILIRPVASPLDSTTLKCSYSKKEKKHVFNTVTWDSNLQYPDPKSTGRVTTPGGDLLDDHDLLTPCAGTLRTIAFTIYLIQPAGYSIFCWFLVGRQHGVSLKIVTCEPRPFLKTYLLINTVLEKNSIDTEWAACGRKDWPLVRLLCEGGECTVPSCHAFERRERCIRFRPTKASLGG